MELITQLKVNEEFGFCEVHLMLDESLYEQLREDEKLPYIMSSVELQVRRLLEITKEKEEEKK